MQDLGRRDDLCSWLYVVAELLEGVHARGEERRREGEGFAAGCA